MAIATDALAPTTQAHPKTRRSRRGSVPFTISQAVRRVATGEAFRHQGLSARGRQVLGYVVSRASAREGGAPCWPSRARIAAKLECSPRTAIRRIGELVDAGILEYAGQARSRHSGRYLNGHLRLTRASCAELGLAWLTVPGPASTRATETVAMHSPQPRRGAPSAPVQPPAGPMAAGEGGRPRMAPGQGVTTSQSEVTSSALSSSRRQSRVPRQRRGPVTEDAYVRVGGWRIPRELLWLSAQGQLPPTGILSLMRAAGQHGKRLSDVVTVARARLANKRGRQLYGYLCGLLAKPVDFAYLARSAQAAKTAAEAASATQGRIAAFQREAQGVWYEHLDGRRYRLLATATPMLEVWEEGTRATTPLTAPFLDAIAAGRIRVKASGGAA